MNWEGRKSGRRAHRQLSWWPWLPNEAPPHPPIAPQHCSCTVFLPFPSLQSISWPHPAARYHSWNLIHPYPMLHTACAERSNRRGSSTPILINITVALRSEHPQTYIHIPPHHINPFIYHHYFFTTYSLQSGVLVCLRPSHYLQGNPSF